MPILGNLYLGRTRMKFDIYDGGKTSSGCMQKKYNNRTLFRR